MDLGFIELSMILTERILFGTTFDVVDAFDLLSDHVLGVGLVY